MPTETLSVISRLKPSKSCSFISRVSTSTRHQSPFASSLKAMAWILTSKDMDTGEASDTASLAGSPSKRSRKRASPPPIASASPAAPSTSASAGLTTTTTKESKEKDKAEPLIKLLAREMVKMSMEVSSLKSIVTIVYAVDKSDTQSMTMCAEVAAVNKAYGQKTRGVRSHGLGPPHCHTAGAIANYLAGLESVKNKGISVGVLREITTDVNSVNNTVSSCKIIKTFDESYNIIIAPGQMTHTDEKVKKAWATLIQAIESLGVQRRMGQAPKSAGVRAIIKAIGDKTNKQ